MVGLAMLDGSKCVRGKEPGANTDCQQCQEHVYKEAVLGIIEEAPGSSAGGFFIGTVHGT